MFVNRVSQRVSRLTGRKALVPTILEAELGQLDALRELLGQFGFTGRVFQTFGMVASVLPSEVLRSVLLADEAIHRVYLDAPVAIPEAFPADALSFVDGVLPALRPGYYANVGERAKEWVGTEESRRWLGVDRAEAAGITGFGVKVAVVDTDSSFRYQRQQQLRGRVIGHSIRGPMGMAGDSNGHGGHVTCTAIGGAAESPLGLPVKGIAPGAVGLGVKVLYTPAGSGSVSDILAGIEYAIAQGARVINLSLGSEDPVSEEDDAMCAAIEKVPDSVVFCVAAGNSGPDAGSVNSPGSCSKALTVGAVDIRTGLVAEFSSRGPTPDGHVKPDTAMPGVDIYSGITPGTLLDVVGDGATDGFAPLSGTSMATPHAAGMVALMIEMYENHLGIPVTGASIKALLEAQAKGKDNAVGWGPLTWDVILSGVPQGTEAPPEKPAGE